MVVTTPKNSAPDEQRAVLRRELLRLIIKREAQRRQQRGAAEK